MVNHPQNGVGVGGGGAKHIYLILTFSFLHLHLSVTVVWLQSERAQKTFRPVPVGLEELQALRSAYEIISCTTPPSVEVYSDNPFFC